MRGKNTQCCLKTPTLDEVYGVGTHSRVALQIGQTFGFAFGFAYAAHGMHESEVDALMSIGRVG